MKDGVFKFAWACRCIVAAICFGGGVWMAFRGVDGWGWFLFVGLFVTPYMSNDKS